MLSRAPINVATLHSHFNQIDPDELRYGARIGIWVRWLVLITCFLMNNYRVDYGANAYWLLTVYAVVPMFINGYAHYRLHTNRSLTPTWLLALHGTDLLAVGVGILVTGGFHSSFVNFCYPALAMFAVVFTSAWLTFGWTTLTAAGYSALCFTVGTGMDFSAQQEQVLFTRVVAMYAISMAVNLVARYDRARRRAAVEREMVMQGERIEISQNIHDTVAQSAYLIGLGLESAIENEDLANQEQVARLEAIHALSKSAMWELRHPINVGLVFQGRELGTALRQHASTFTTITGIPAEVIQHGSEPSLSHIARSRLFSVAHNAMTNALRHAQANRVTIELDFRHDCLRMSITDDGVGLPDDYAQKGHGFGNMAADAGRVGGRLEVQPGGARAGTAVTCVMPYVGGRRDD